MGGRGSNLFGQVFIDLTGVNSTGTIISPLITAGLTELRGNEADPESTLQRIDDVRFNNMTHEQLFVVDKEGFVREGYDGNQCSVSFPPDRAAQWKDCIVTHRHPDTFGGTFSFADIHCIAAYGWAEHEASANEGRYAIKRTNHANGAGLIRQLKLEASNIEAQMKQVGGKINQNKYASKSDYLNDSRRQQLQIVEKWYEKNLPKYGFTYTFTPREAYKDDGI